MDEWCFKDRIQTSQRNLKRKTKEDSKNHHSQRDTDTENSGRNTKTSPRKRLKHIWHRQIQARREYRKIYENEDTRIGIDSNEICI